MRGGGRGAAGFGRFCLGGVLHAWQLLAVQLHARVFDLALPGSFSSQLLHPTKWVVEDAGCGRGGVVCSCHVILSSFVCFARVSPFERHQ